MASATPDLTVQKLFAQPLQNKVALVTGGGTGIGLMATQALAANGCKVFITGRRKEALEQAASTHQPKAGGGSIHTIVGDITSKDSISNIIKELSSQEKQLDILINNAGISGPTRSVEKGEEEGAESLAEELWKDSFEDWTNVYNTNVTGYYFLSVKALPLLAQSTMNNPGWSAGVVNISSISGITNTTQHHYAYNSSKAATIQLTTLLAQEFSQSKGVLAWMHQTDQHTCMLIKLYFCY